MDGILSSLGLQGDSIKMYHHHDLLACITVHLDSSKYMYMKTSIKPFVSSGASACIVTKAGTVC